MPPLNGYPCLEQDLKKKVSVVSTDFDISCGPLPVNVLYNVEIFPSMLIFLWIFIRKADKRFLKAVKSFLSIY